MNQNIAILMICMLYFSSCKKQTIDLRDDIIGTYSVYLHYNASNPYTVPPTSFDTTYFYKNITVYKGDSARAVKLSVSNYSYCAYDNDFNFFYNCQSPYGSTPCDNYSFDRVANSISFHCESRMYGQYTGKSENYFGYKIK